MKREKAKMYLKHKTCAQTLSFEKTYSNLLNPRLVHPLMNIGSTVSVMFSTVEQSLSLDKRPPSHSL